ncbi:Tellurite resistance protein TerB [Ekhidna lutea]|uniref:Tellurite resistance protein TerB n=1 Tax=Ekhidna lutea TaxID=447679 RepID=A0A239EVR5_EKHLU|nr:TerB family tellurite resistance protein [Ekhidna lutea]SNS48531.1 Tellurite resistance protein TerB [Ekhidna lutea]
MKDVVKFRALIGIAQADGDFDSAEKEFIRNLAELEGLSMKELKELLQTADKTGNLVKDLDFDDKIDILTYMVKLMKIDGKVLISEIKFCEKVARGLGFEEKSIGFLSGIIEGNPTDTPNFGSIKHRMRKYIIE